MIEYALRDDGGNEFNLNGSTSTLITLAKNSLTPGESNIERDVNIIQRSYKDGAVAPGVPRTKSKELAINLSIATDTVNTFRTNINLLEFWCRKTEKLIDKTNSRSAEVKYKGLSIRYDAGSYLKSANVTITFEHLNPYWFTNSYTTASDSGADISLEYNNNGYVESPPIITIVAEEACENITIIEETTRRGIAIADLTFGVSALYKTYTIDCETGEAKLSGVTGNRNNRIQAGTGFFDLPVGNGSISIQTPVSVSASMQFRKGYLL
jgi:phage-related protein